LIAVRSLFCVTVIALPWLATLAAPATTLG